MYEQQALVVPFLVEQKRGAVDASMAFAGRGAVCSNVDAYGDVIAPGAFSAWLDDVKSGKQPWPSMLSQHGGMGFTADDLTPVGVYTDLAEADNGLAVEGELADTPRGNELRTLMRMKPRPAIDGLSIGYVAREWEQGNGSKTGGGRTLKRIDVMEISLVTFPANRSARVTSVKGVRPQTIRELEGALHAIGYSTREAKRLACAGWGALRSAIGDEGIESALRNNIAILSGR
ncbi:MAG: HK97 family phage prohead protease [Alphaproteobacteria bacterium]|nr:HK97 family phage prohead protease [Alphaproteobacteria bacterium]